MRRWLRCAACFVYFDPCFTVWHVSHRNVQVTRWMMLPLVSQLQKFWCFPLMFRAEDCKLEPIRLLKEVVVPACFWKSLKGVSYFNGECALKVLSVCRVIAGLSIKCVPSKPCSRMAVNKQHYARTSWRYDCDYLRVEVCWHRWDDRTVIHVVLGFSRKSAVQTVWENVDLQQKFI